MKKKIFFIVVLVVCASGVHAQPVGAPNTTVPSGVTFSSFSWFRGGNNAGGAAGPNNIFGTAAGFNSGIYTETNGINRTRLNGTQTSVINGVAQNVDGYFGIAPNGFFATNSPYSMLHLQGPVSGAFFTGGGWRSWMKTGMFANEDSDAMYVGLKTQGPGTNRSDAIVAWSDDGAGLGSVDKLRFVFTSAFNNPTSLDPLNPLSLPGYEYMRMLASSTQFNSTGNPVGNVGIGPVFTDLLPPTNRLHMNAEENLAVFMQISNQIGTGQTATDGLKCGYAPTSATNKEAQINQQENDRLTLYTNNGERIRIMHIGALNNSVGFNPGGLPTNITRVAISEDPANAITRPLSLLHIGYNTVGAANDGWRPWMDVGMFVSKFSDNVYLGLKAEPGIIGIPGLDRHDAVLNWGDNQVSSIPTNGPDNFRFIFTSSTSGGGGTPPATGPNGLEAGRMTPTLATGVFTGFGGDPTFPNLYSTGTANPGNTMEVNSWGTTLTVGGSSGLRFTNLNTTSPTLANPGGGVLSVDANGDVIYVPASTVPGTGIGNYCSPTPGANPLIGHYEIPMASNNYYFSGNGLPNTNSVSVGRPCSFALSAKFNSYQNAGVTVGVNTIAGAFLNEDVANIQGPIFTGVVGIARGVNPLGKVVNRGGFFSAANAPDVRGVVVDIAPSANNNAAAFGGEFNVNSTAATNIAVVARCGGAVGGAGSNFGVFSSVTGSNINNIGGSFQAFGLTTASNVGVGGSASGSSTSNVAGSFITSLLTTPTGLNIGVSARVGNITSPTLPINNAIAVYGNSDSPLNMGVPGYAGYFDGDVFVNGPSSGTGFVLTSDSQFKTSVDSISNASLLLSQLLPKSFYFDTLNVYDLNFSSQKQYGLIAQDVENFMPELVSTVTKAPMVDTLGNVVTPGVTYKALNYNAFIALLIKGYQNQQSKIDSLNDENDAQDSINASLQNQINLLADMINSCCSSSSAMQAQGGQNASVAVQTNVNLRDGQSVVLEQNVPNPYSEQTTINYFLPDNVSKAQILFYNAQGRLIQSTELTQKGKGQLNVFASDLSNGVYTYTLVVDGKIIETKKMVKQQ